MRALLEGTLKYSLVLGFFFSPSDSLPGSILCCEHFAHQLAVPLRATVRRGRVTHADMKACTVFSSHVCVSQFSYNMDIPFPFHVGRPAPVLEIAGF